MALAIVVLILCQVLECIFLKWFIKNIKESSYKLKILNKYINLFKAYYKLNHIVVFKSSSNINHKL